MKNLVGWALGILVAVVCQQPVWADCAAVYLPGEANYTTMTNKCAFGAVPFSFTETCEVNGEAVATFSPPLQVRRPSLSWGIWSSPPFSETASPTVGFNPTSKPLRVELFNDSTYVGMEAEGNIFALHTITVSFKDANLVEVFNRTLQLGPIQGARLFAAECDGGTSIRFVDVSTPPETLGFAIAQVRSGSFPPGFAGAGLGVASAER